MKAKARRSDIWFFGILILMLLTLPLQIGFPEWGVWVAFQFWWVILLPYVVIKIFFMKSKLFKWLNTEIELW